MAIATLISPSKLFYLKLTVNNLPIFTLLLPALQNSAGLRRKRPSLHQISAGNTRQSLICSQLRACHESKWLSSSPRSDLATEAFNFSPFRWRSNLTPRRGRHSNGSAATQIISEDRESTTVRLIVADKGNLFLSVMRSGDDKRIFVRILKTFARNGERKKRAASLLQMILKTEAKQGILPQRDSGWLRVGSPRVGENSQVSRVASRQSAVGVVQVNTEECDCSRDSMALGGKKYQTNKY